MNTMIRDTLRRRGAMPLRKIQRRACVLRAEALEPRVLLTLAHSEAFARYQNLTDNPPPVSDPSEAELRAFAFSDIDPSFASAEGHAIAEAPGVLRSKSDARAAVDLLPPEADPVDRRVVASSLGRQTTEWIITGVPAGTLVPIDLTVDVEGFLETQNFSGGGITIDWGTTGADALVQVSQNGTTSDVFDATAELADSVLTVAGPWTFTFVPRFPGAPPGLGQHVVDFNQTFSQHFVVEAGTSFTMTAELATDAFVAQPLELVATADFFTGDGFSFSMSAGAGTLQPFVAPAAQSDLVVALTDAPDPVPEGGNVTYTATVTNIGPNVATDVLLDLAVDPSFIITAVTGPGTLIGGPQNRVDLGAIPAGQQAVVQYTALTSIPGTFSATTEVASTTADPNASNNQATIDTTVIDVPDMFDLVVTVADQPDPVFAGDELTYTITVRNNGPDTATNVGVTTSIPAAAVVSVIPTTGLVIPISTISWAVGDLPAGAVEELTVVLEPNVVGTLTNSAAITGVGDELNPADNQATVETEVQPAADLSVSISDDPDPADIAQQITHMIVVRNDGPSDATGVTVEHTLPADATLVSATSTAGTITGTSVLTAALGDMPSGAQETITVVFLPTAAGTLASTATVVADENDPDLSNNQALSQTVVVDTRAGLSITLVDSPDPVTADDQLTYTYTATNEGPSDAADVTVSIELAPGVVFVPPGPGGPVYTQTGNIVTGNIGGLAAGTSAMFSIIVVPTAAGTIDATATVASTQFDPDPANNTATASTVVDPFVPAMPAAGYAFSILAQSTPGGALFPPSINDSGTVAYVERILLGPNAGSTVYTANGGSPMPLATTTSSFTLPAESFGEPRINNNGTVVFPVRRSDSSGGTEFGVYTVEAGAISPVRVLAGPTDTTAFADINDGGTVSFVEVNTVSTLLGPGAVRTASGGAITTPVDSPSLLFDRIFGGGAISETGATVFLAIPADGGQGVYVAGAGTIATIVDDLSPAPGTTFWSSFSHASISDSGRAAFVADFRQGPQVNLGIFTGVGGPLTTIVESTGPFSDFSRPSVRNDGSVVFRANLDSGGHGIFSGPDPVADKVIATGDSLAGSVVTFLTFQDRGTNSSGEVAFGATLADGRQVIVVASPDNDTDGVADSVEDAAPGGGDGNADGVLDSAQNNVASLPSTAGGYVTLVSPVGTMLVDVAAISNPSPADTPAAAQFPLGFFEFSVEGVSAGGATTVELILHDEPVINSYYKHGATPSNPAPHWYEFLFDGTTGAELVNDDADPGIERMILHFIDGQRGDDDLAANGVIVDPGAPGFVESIGAAPTIDSVVINDGHAQRSKINSITVSFDSAVTIAPGAFELVHESGVHIALAIDLSEVAGSTVVVLTFNSPWIIGGSLFNGDYTLVVHGDKITGQNGAALDGDNDGAAGGNHRAEFFRLFGDSDGDGDVDHFDRNAFLATFPSRAGDPDYLWYFDYNDDGRVAVIDLLAFTVASIFSHR